MLYLLDTNIVNYIRNGNDKVVTRWESLRSRSFISAITTEEILSRGYFSAINTIRSTGKGDLLRAYEDLLRAIDDLSEFNALPYGNKAEAIFKTKKLKGMDGRIAAHALELGYIVVTENTKDFEKIAGLKLENWAE